MGLDINAKGLALIKSFEGLHSKKADGMIHAYLDPVGVPTIGWGCTKGIKMGMKLTEAECERLLMREIATFEDGVERLVKVPLNENQYACLVSFSYNVGLGNLGKSTLLRELNKGNYKAVPGQLMRFVNAGGRKFPGLVRRRAAEGALWIEPVAEQLAPRREGVEEEPEVELMPQKVEVAKAPITDAAKSPTIWSTVVALFSSIWAALGSVASDTTTEVVATKQSLSGFEALWSHFGISLGGVLLAVTIACLGVVLVRHLSRYSEGRA